MAYENDYLFGKAVEITKAYARSDGTRNLETVLAEVYKKLKELNEDLK